MPKIHLLDKNLGTPEARWDVSYEDEHLFWPRICFLDPGVVSGLATVWFDPAALIQGKTMRTVLLAYSGELLRGPEREQVGRYLARAADLSPEGSPGLALGVETFTPRMVSYDKAFLAPVRIRAAAEYALDADKTLHEQSPSDALGSWSNDRLKALGVYTPGPDHINDALRHCMLWIAKARGWRLAQLYAAHGREPAWGLDPTPERVAAAEAARG